MKWQTLEACSHLRTNNIKFNGSLLEPIAVEFHGTWRFEFRLVVGTLEKTSFFNFNWYSPFAIFWNLSSSTSFSQRFLNYYYCYYFIIIIFYILLFNFVVSFGLFRLFICNNYFLLFTIILSFFFKLSTVSVFTRTRDREQIMQINQNT